MQQQPKCSGRLRFEPLALSTASGADGAADPSIAAANAWVDIPAAGEEGEQQQAIGKAKFNLEYEKVRP